MLVFAWQSHAWLKFVEQAEWLYIWVVDWKLQVELHLKKNVGDFGQRHHTVIVYIHFSQWQNVLHAQMFCEHLWLN